MRFSGWPLEAYPGLPYIVTAGGLYPAYVRRKPGHQMTNASDVCAVSPTLRLDVLPYRAVDECQERCWSPGDKATRSVLSGPSHCVARCGPLLRKRDPGLNSTGSGDHPLCVLELMINDAQSRAGSDVRGSCLPKHKHPLALSEAF